MSSHHDLTDQVAVITGSSSGIGRAIALELASAGADVVVHAGHDRSAAEETAAAVGQLGRAAHVLVANLTLPEQVDTLASNAWKWRGSVDIWVNNAGADILTGAAAQMTFDQKLTQLWQVDVLAVVRLSRLIGQQMKQRGGGAIVNIGWDQVDTGMEGDSGELFATTKGAVMAFTRSLAKSLAPQVRVNCVAPGWIQTGWGDAASDYWQQRAKNESLLGRWGTPEDVARAVRFLVSLAAEFVNGQVIYVNGGRG